MIKATKQGDVLNATVRNRANNTVWLAVIHKLPAVVCFAGAAAIIIVGGDVGWGWLIFAGILVS